MDDHFDRNVSGLQGLLFACPGMGPSPQDWRHASSAQQPDGRIMCEGGKNYPALEWTINSQLVVGDLRANLVVGGPSLETLFAWWAERYE